MGSATCAAVEAADDLELAARIGSSDPLRAVVHARADVAVEFTTPATVAGNAATLLELGVHTVVGATGLSDDDLGRLGRLALDGNANCLVAANFAVGAVLLMRLAAEAARVLGPVEITELHHDRKVDAPSGTALATARAISSVRGDRAVAVPGPPDVAARGLVVEGVPVHSVRLPGLVASQEVVFGAEGQTLTLRHDTVDRTAFMPGVLLAVRRVADLPGLTTGLDPLL